MGVFVFKEGMLQTFSVFITPIGLCLIASSAWGITLPNAYQSATRHRAAISTSHLEEEIADSSHSRAIASLLPSLSVTSSHTLRDPISGTSTASTFGQRYQHTATLTLKQPIFQGGAEYAGLGYASAERQIANFRTKQAELDLAVEVATGFYGLATLNSEITNLLEQDDILEKRVVFLQRWVRIGRSKPSELTAVQSQKAKIAADVSKAQSERQVAYERFLWLTGLENANEIEWETPTAPIPTQIDVENLPSVRALELEMENTERSRSIARADYWPSVDVEGNYYLQRAGILAASRWDLNLTLTWNLFSGGATAAESTIKAKEAQKKEIELRDLKHRIRQDFLGQQRLLEFQKRTVEKLEQAVRYSRKNYLEQQEEFKKGLITNLEVLRAIDDYLQVKRALDRENIASRLAAVRLRALLGEKP
ncbi:MAG: TolC family protein [Bdellovibrionales bacterium]|nr:TolC family protein [Bdellovibrionales bacterium]